MECALWLVHWQTWQTYVTEIVMEGWRPIRRQMYSAHLRPIWRRGTIRTRGGIGLRELLWYKRDPVSVLGDSFSSEGAVENGDGNWWSQLWQLEGMTWSFCRQKHLLFPAGGGKGVGGDGRGCRAVCRLGAGSPFSYWLHTCSAEVSYIDHKDEWETMPVLSCMEHSLHLNE